MYKVVVFDWDGTLVDSEAHIVASITAAAEHAGLESLSYERKKSIIGLGMREALLTLYPGINDQQVQKLREYYAQHFFTKGTTPNDLFPGVKSTLEALKDHGINMAVATGKSRNGLTKALESSGLGHFFDIERCADETRSKPHPMMLEQIVEFYDCSPADMLMVGDTSYDMEMALQAGMPAVGVSYGVHDVAELHPHKPVAIIDEFEHLLRWFR